MKWLLLIIMIIPMTGVLAAEGRWLVETESADGRIRAAWSVSPAEPRLSDTISLTLEIEADTTLQIEMPVFDSVLGELEIVQKTERTVRMTSNRETKQLVLKTVPRQSGITPIWATPIYYVDQREGLREKSYSITVPAAELEIKSAVTPESASLDQISTTSELFDIQSISLKTLLWIVFFFVLVTGFVLYFFFRFRRQPETLLPESNLTPQEIALRRLTLLIESRLHETDVKTFFIELTGIVRWYIEQQTDIRAPELTTEEFLHEITQQWERRVALPTELRDRLRLFLESSDMVKFAKFQPSQDEIMIGVRKAEEFLSLFAPKTIPQEIQTA